MHGGDPVVSRKRLLKTALLLVSAFLLVEAALWFHSYRQLSSAREELGPLASRLSLSTLETEALDVPALRRDLDEARGRLTSVRRHLSHDPLLKAAFLVPFLDEQAKALERLVMAAEASTLAGLSAADVLLAYREQEDDPDLTSIQEGIHFLESQADPMASVRLHLDQMTRHRAAIGADLLAPLAGARDELDSAIARLQQLTTGYERARTILPEMLGMSGRRQYLVLAQNDTELFPSGGLISNYGIATFERGQLTDMEFEYFINLFDRWQAQSGEYIEPPDPLRNYLLRHVSWGLGEAGWYPDFPTTARLAASFVEKGGAPPVDGVIALDLQFVEALLRLLGPIMIDEHDVTLTADNLNDTVLELTRGEKNYPGSPGKGFLSDLARKLLTRIFAAPKEQWPDLLVLLDRMSRERHLQLNFASPALQGTAVEYGLAGDIARQPHGDFLLLADTSVNSTKLNLILETEAQVLIRLSPEGSLSRIVYSARNPFPEWEVGRDPRLVSALMHEGVYGSYLRIFALEEAQFLDLRLNGRPDGPEQAGIELGLRAFGRFFPVLPGQKSTLELIYYTPGTVVEQDARYTYRLYIQKQPGPRAMPVTIATSPPPDAVIESIRLDGQNLADESIVRTDLRTDRVLEVVWSVRAGTV
jgi:hypothetical protein